MRHVRRVVPRVRTLVVGRGPATSSLMARVLLPRHDKMPSDCDFNVVRLQPEASMWEGFDPDFEMGQSRDTLIEPRYQKNYLEQRFLKVRDFNKYMKERDKDSLKGMEATDVAAMVLKIKKYADNDLHVTYFDKMAGTISELMARQIYFSPGPGLEKSILSEVPYQPRSSGGSRPFVEYPGAVSILTNQVLIGSGGCVGVVGDGPTALWAAKMVADKGNRVVLLGPDMPTAFAQSNPGGRNSGILRSLSDNFYIGSVVAVEERPVSKGADWEEAGTMLVIQDFRPHNFRSKGRTVHLPLSAIVSAIGPTTDVSPVIDPGLLNSLTVVPGCLALATENEDFILFGSGAYSQAKSLKQAVSFDEAGKLIRQPAVGVATIDMGAREFSRTKQDAWKIKQDVALSEIQPSSASAQEFRGMLQRHGVDMKAAEEMTAQILEARAGIAVHREYTNSDLADHLHKLFSGKPLVEAENKS